MICGNRWKRAGGLAGAGMVLMLAGAAGGAISTTQTVDPAALSAALRPTGLTIDAVIVRAGMPGQFGTSTNFSDGPVTIRGGVAEGSDLVQATGRESTPTAQRRRGRRIGRD